MNDQFVLHDPITVTLGNMPDLSERRINTDRMEMDTVHMKHIEGGWPKGYDYTEAEATKKYKKKVEKDTPDYNNIIFQLVQQAREALI